MTSLEWELTRAPWLTIVTPAFNEAANLSLLYERLIRVLDSLGSDWEWVVVDDHSADHTFETVARIAASDPRVHAVRFARNSGSHAAIAYGLRVARGAAAVVLAGDLQDPPEVVPRLIDEWHSGVQVVWAARSSQQARRHGLTVGHLYYLLMRHAAGLKSMPAAGADFFLVDRRVMDALRQFTESNSSILALITWMGFRQSTVSYDKLPRQHGRSGWSLEKKIKLVLDSITSWTYLPIRLMSYVGFVVSLLGFAYAALVVASALAGRPPEGWSSLMVVLLVIGGIQMLMMGILGEYVWRALDEARRRPRYLIEATTDDEHAVTTQVSERSVGHSYELEAPTR
jgi:polyisoprenyl-phosphate glycosyltransferase